MRKSLQMRRLRTEALEQRKMLAGADVVVGAYDALEVTFPGEGTNVLYDVFDTKTETLVIDGYLEETRILEALWCDSNDKCRKGTLDVDMRGLGSGHVYLDLVTHVFATEKYAGENSVVSETQLASAVIEVTGDFEVFVAEVTAAGWSREWRPGFSGYDENATFIVGEDAYGLMGVGGIDVTARLEVATGLIISDINLFEIGMEGIARIGESHMTMEVEGPQWELMGSSTLTAADSAYNFTNSDADIVGRTSNLIGSGYFTMEVVNSFRETKVTYVGHTTDLNTRVNVVFCKGSDWNGEVVADSMLHSQKYIDGWRQEADDVFLGSDGYGYLNDRAVMGSTSDIVTGIAHRIAFNAAIADGLYAGPIDILLGYMSPGD